MTAPVTLGAGGLAGDDHRYAQRVRSNLLGAGGQGVRSIRLPCRWKTDPCSKPDKAEWAPQASSTVRACHAGGRYRAMDLISAQVL
jgi:hypothetical protein